MSYSTMAIIICILGSNLLLFFSGWTLGKIHQEKKISPNVMAQQVISLLQENLLKANNNRGFQTRTHVTNWLGGMRKNVREAIDSGAINGRTSR